AFEKGAWKKMPASQRGLLMSKLADLIEKHADELAQLEALDNGKPYSVARAADLPLTIACYRYYAGWADKLQGKTIVPVVRFTLTELGSTDGVMNSVSHRQDGQFPFRRLAEGNLTEI